MTITRLTQLEFSKNRVQHHHSKGLAEVLDMPPIVDSDPDDGFPEYSSGQGPLVDPFAGASTEVPLMPEPPDLDARDVAAQYVELIWMSLLRDVPFANYDSDPMVDEARNELADKWGIIDPFRPDSFADGGGDYISRLMQGSVPDGDPLLRWDRLCSDMQGQAYGKNITDACRMQSGDYDDELPPSTTRTLPIGHSGRTLASVVRQDYPMKFCLQASLLLAELGVPSQRNREYEDLHRFAAPFVHYGITHLHDLMSSALRYALRCAWKNKWTYKYARPELYGLALEMHRRGDIILTDVREELFHSQAFRSAIDKYGGVMLTQCYPEGSPAHPSYPAGHAAVAWFCATILKLWFWNVDWPGDMRKDAPGVHGEINKMAANVSTGRSHAGVHWRYDNTVTAHYIEPIAIEWYKKHVNVGCETPRQESARFLSVDGAVKVVDL